MKEVIMDSQDIRQHTLLYVDDNLSPCNALFYFLRKKGLKIYVAENGKEAIQIVEDIKPDIILMDVFMPEMDGLEAYQVLQSQPETQQIPVIFMCSTALMEDEAFRQKFVGLEYVTRPIDLPKLWERIAVHLKLT
jgi:two-component system sensor histidine kinase/response regulator